MNILFSQSHQSICICFHKSYVNSQYADIKHTHTLTQTCSICTLDQVYTVFAYTYILILSIFTYIHGQHNIDDDIETQTRYSISMTQDDSYTLSLCDTCDSIYKHTSAGLYAGKNYCQSHVLGEITVKLVYKLSNCA